MTKKQQILNIINTPLPEYNQTIEVNIVLKDRMRMIKDILEQNK